MKEIRLINAARFGNLLELNLLIIAGMNVNDVDDNKKSALIWAAENGHDKVVKQLIQAQADIEYVDQGTNGTALTLAAEWGHVNVVQHLIQARANVNHADRFNRTTLIYFAMKGNVFVVKSLIKAGANVDHADQSGKTALIYAVELGNLPIVQCLLGANANIRHTDQSGKTAVLWAIERGYKHIFNAFIRKDIDILNLIIDNPEALRWAALNLSTTIVEHVLKTTLINFQTNEGSFDQSLLMINHVTDHLKGSAHKKTRGDLKKVICNFVTTHRDSLLKEWNLEKIEVYLSRLIAIRDGLNIIQPNEREIFIGKEKAVMKELKSTISTLQRLIDKRKPLPENCISRQILQLFEPISEVNQAEYSKKPEEIFSHRLSRLIARLVEPNEAEVAQIRRTVSALPGNQRFQLRAALKKLLDDTAMKNKDDLEQGDRWIETLYQHYQSHSQCVPFMVILRVSTSGESTDYNTATWNHFVNVMQNGLFRINSGKSHVRQVGLFSGSRTDEVGQLENAKLKQYQLGNNDL